MKILDRLGFRFTETADDYGFRLGPRAGFFLWLVFIVNSIGLLAAIGFGIMTPVSVKAPFTGAMEPRQVHKVFPTESGSITELRVRPGDRVVAGDTLALLGVTHAPANQRVTIRSVALKSPHPGTVLAVAGAVGERVSPAAAIVDLADLEHLVLVGWVPEFYRRRLLVGQEAVVRFPIYLGHHFRGAVLRIAPAAQIIQGRSMYEVRLDVTPPEYTGATESGSPTAMPLQPGMNAAGDVLADRMPALKYLVAVRMLHRY